MTKYEMVNNKIEELEANFVIANVRLENGTIESIEAIEELESIVAFEVVTVDAYEENGFDVEGLEGEWVEL